jgi:transcriptional regulator with PAS, ATPase and Fis domain
MTFARAHGGEGEPARDRDRSRVGATGTGKELFARHIHERSGRPGLLVDVNCCALPRDMVESLLFGHRRGAFTGAIDSAVGHLERSDGGTLFLDELASFALDAQGKLLRALDTGEVQPLGATNKRRVDLRVVSAVQDGFGGDIESGVFRRDLYQRVAGVVIELPPLTARLEDVVPLAEHFAAVSGRRLEPGVERVLQSYAWPGNVRELRLVIERAGELVENGTLPSAALAEAIALGNANSKGPGPSFVRSRAEVLAVLQSSHRDVQRAAAALHVGRTTLFKELKALGISLRAERRVARSPSSVNGGERSELPRPLPTLSR